MLVNFPFLPEPEEKVTEWLERAKEIELEEAMIDKLNLRTASRYIPNNIPLEALKPFGIESNDGFYESKLNYDYQSVRLEDKFSISTYELNMYLPVITKEIRDDSNSRDYVPQHLFGSGDETKLCEERLYDCYGWVLDIKDFMDLIGNQLQKSKRKFCVSFCYREYDDGLFYKNGRLYHPNHSQTQIEIGDGIYNFHIYELIEEGEDFILENHDDKLAYMSQTIHAETKDELMSLLENVHNEDFVSKEIAKHKLEMEKIESC